MAGGFAEECAGIQAKGGTGKCTPYLRHDNMPIQENELCSDN